MNITRTTKPFFLLLLTAVLSWPQVQSPKPAESATKDTHANRSTTRGPHSGHNGVPQTIRVGNADVPLTEIVPGTEQALDRLQEILNKTKDPALRDIQNSLATLAATIEKSQQETLYVVRNTRSTDVFSEARFPWRRNRRELDDLNKAVQSRVQSLTEKQRQVREIRERWALADTSVKAGVFPEGLLQGIQRVQEVAANADEALRSSLESVVQLQVQISEKRAAVDDVLRQIDAAEERLHESIFVLDSPPLWLALRGSSYVSVREQARITLTTTRSRVISFYHLYRNNLVAYLILLSLLACVFSHLKRRLGRLSPEQYRAEQGILQLPISLAAFTVLFLFGAFFPNAPAEVYRFSRLLLIIPTVRIAIKEFEKQLRLPVITLALFFAVDNLTSHVTAGTVLRRLLVLTLTIVGLAGLAWLLRASSAVRLLLLRRSWAVGLLVARGAFIFLAAAAAANVVGSVLLADVLLHGTLMTIYAGVAVYVTYRVLSQLIALLTTTRVGQMSRLVRLHRNLVLAHVDTILKLLSWIAWLISTLFSYQILQQAYAGFQGVLEHKWAIGAVSISLKDVFLFILVLGVAMVVARVIRFFLEEEIFPRTSVRVGVAQSGSRLTYFALVFIGFFLAMAASGIDLGRLTLLTGAFGVGLGFGLQSLVNNIVSGILISLERPMQVGDVIEVENLLGKVTAIGFRSSTVRTDDGAEVIVPNSELITKPFVNWSLSDQLRRGQLRIGVAYGTDPAHVLKILTNAVRSHPAVLKNPEPFITFEEFGDSALEFCVRFWTSIDKHDRVRSDLNVFMADELSKNGIAIPLPQRDVHLHMAENASVGSLRGGFSRPIEEADEPVASMKQSVRQSR